MAIPTRVISAIESNNFRFDVSNPYTHIAGYYKVIRDLRYNDTHFGNCAVLIETEYDNFITFRIVGYHTGDESFRDITGVFYASLDQIIELTDIGNVLRTLNRSAFASRSQYAL